MSSDKEKELIEENRKLRARLSWIHALMRNETIQPRDKVVLYEAEYEINQSDKNEDGLSHIFVWKIADETGIGRNGVSKSLQLLAEHGVLRRRIFPVTNERTGIPEKANFLALTDVARNPSQISLPTSKHGGKRVKGCINCGNTEFIVHITKETVCTCCGLVDKKETWNTEENTNAELE